MQYSSNEASLILNSQNTEKSVSAWLGIAVRATGILQEVSGTLVGRWEKSDEIQGKLKNRLYLKGHNGKNQKHFLQRIKTFPHTYFFLLIYI